METRAAVPAATSGRVTARALIGRHRKTRGTLSGGANPLYGAPLIHGSWRERHVRLTELITGKRGPGEINEGREGLMDGKNIRGTVVHRHRAPGDVPGARCAPGDAQRVTAGPHHGRANGQRGASRKGRSSMPNAILDPTGTATSSAAKPAAPRAPRLASLRGKRVGLLINTKVNARPFLEEVGRLLQERYDVTLTERTKVNFAVPEPEEVIKDLVAENDVVITGVGDCGSCSAAAAADGVVLEAAGLPVAAIITESFVPTANAMAALRGAPGYKYATTAHPVAVLTEEKVRERAAQVLDDVVALLVQDAGKAEA